MLNDNSGLILILSILVVTFVYSQYKKNILSQKINSIKEANNSKEILFICNGIEEIDTGLWQLYGEVDGGEIWPLKSTININGAKYEVFEVYADQDTPNKPSLVAPDKSTNIALLFKDNNFNYRSFKQDLKISKVLALKIVNS